MTLSSQLFIYDVDNPLNQSKLRAKFNMCMADTKCASHSWFNCDKTDCMWCQFFLDVSQSCSVARHQN